MAKAKARKAPKLKVVRGGKLTAVYQRDPEDRRYWLAHIAEDERCHTFGRSFKQAQAMLLDVASLWFERKIAADDLEEMFVLPEDVKRWGDAYAEAEERLRQAQQNRDAVRYGFIRKLLDSDISTRPSSQIVGTLGRNPLSHQRVQQIATDAELKALARQLAPYLPDGQRMGGGPPQRALKAAGGGYAGAKKRASKKAPRKGATKKRASDRPKKGRAPAKKKAAKRQKR